MRLLGGWIRQIRLLFLATLIPTCPRSDERSLEKIQTASSWRPEAWARAFCYSQEDDGDENLGGSLGSGAAFGRAGRCGEPAASGRCLDSNRLCHRYLPLCL